MLTGSCISDLALDPHNLGLLSARSHGVLRMAIGLLGILILLDVGEISSKASYVMVSLVYKGIIVKRVAFLGLPLRVAARSCRVFVVGLTRVGCGLEVGVEARS